MKLLNMKIYIYIVVFITSLSAYSQINLQVIKSSIAKPGDYQYADSLDDLHEGEKWGFHSRAIGNAIASSCLNSTGSFTYNIENISDLNLKTAWVEGQDDYGKGEFFTFTVKFDKNTNFGSSSQFYGKIEVFNGYCKSERLWKQNSRVKSLKMYLNDIPICLIELQDSWQYQSVDVKKFFKDSESDSYFEGSHVLNDGDQLKFEIIDIYPGEKFQDVAISEFVADGAPN